MEGTTKREWQVGDVVRIRGDLIAGLPYMGIHIFADQAALFGTCGRIREIDGDAVRVGRWWWHRTALAPVDAETLTAVEALQMDIDLLREGVDLLRRENDILKSRMEGAT